MALFADRNARLDTENAFKIGPYILEAERDGSKVIRCNLGEPDFPVPAHIKDEVKRQLDLDNAHYTDPQGIPPLREAIARHISETRQIRVTPERVVVFPGAKPPIGFCEQVYVNEGEEIIYPSPGFPIYESFTKYVGAVPRPLHLLEEKGFSFGGQDLARLITPKTKLIFLNFPSNPTGGVATEEDLKEMADVILKKCGDDVRVYSDEVYEDILFDGAKHASIASIPGMEKRTIIVSGVSKSYSWTGGRIGWAVFPTEEEARVFKNLNINYFSCVPPYNQWGAKVALEDPRSRDEIRKMVLAFEERRNIVVEALRNIDGISCQMPKGAFYVFPNIEGVCKKLGIFDVYNDLPQDVKTCTSPSTLFQMFLLFRYKVAVMDRKSFGRIGSEDMHYIRISIATAKDDLIQAMARIKEASSDRKGFEDYVNSGGKLF